MISKTFGLFDFIEITNWYEIYDFQKPIDYNIFANFIKNYESMINKQSLDSLMEIYKHSTLDYLGFDFAIRPDGSLLIFEINPAQNAFIKAKIDIFPYMEKVGADLEKAFNDCLLGLGT